MKSIFISSILPFLTLLVSIFSITSKNPVVSVLFLIITFVLASCYIMFLGINFIGISYIIVYVGAIAVLFLFIIMMINIKLEDILETGSQYTKTLPLGLIVVSLFIYIFYLIIPLTFNQFNDIIFSIFENFKLNNEIVFKNFYNIDFYNTETMINNIIQIDNIGFSLYVYGAVLLIICSLILLLAMISAIIISSPKK